jgi:flagellar basal body-associated protein FliL
MPTPTGRGGKIKVLRVAVPALLIGAAAFFFINNRRTDAVVDYEVAKKEAPVRRTAEPARPEPQAPAAETVPAPAAAGPKNAASGPRLNFTVGPVVCATADTARHCLQVGVRLLYSGAALDREIKDKEENIARLVKFVFARKQLAQINADSARAEILEKVNAFLSQGRADDLVFTAFDIIPMEMK